MEPIRLTATSTMVSTWDVELSPAESQYEVHYQNAWGAQEWTYWGEIKQPFDVREAAAALASLYDDGLSGDWLSKIGVVGVDGWRADILRMAAITSDSPCGEHLEFLLQLSDVDIEWVWSRNRSLVTPESLALVECLMYLYGVDDPAPECVDLHNLLEQFGLERSADTITILGVGERHRQEEAAAIERAAMPFGAEINRIVAAFVRVQGDKCSAVRVEAVKNALKRFVAEHGYLPEDELQIPNERNINIRPLRFANVEEFIQQLAPTGSIPPDLLSRCTDFASPTDPFVVERLLRAWVRSADKPKARQLFGLGWQTPLGFLPWACGGVTAEVTAQIADSLSEDWRPVAEWMEEQIGRLESELSGRSTPSNQATAIGNRAKAAFVNWARRLLENAAHLS